MKHFKKALKTLAKRPKNLTIILYTLVSILIIFCIYYYFLNSNNVSYKSHNEDHNDRINKDLNDFKASNDKQYYYTCPMHSTVISDKPGVCPICNMKLVRKDIKKDHSRHENQDEAEKSVNKNIITVSLSPTEVVMANIKTAKPQIKKVHKEIEAFGLVAYDTNKISNVPTWVEGRLDKLYVKNIGDIIHKEEIIAKIYSPLLISTQKEYLLAIKNYEEMKNSNLEELQKSYADTIRAVQTRLKYFGLTDDQILSIKNLDDIKDNIPVYSKYSGTVIKIDVLEGDYVKEGASLFTLADFSTVWLEAQVDETDLSYIKRNQSVDIIIDSYADKTFKGVIDFIYPFMDSKTRTVKVRITMPNYNLMLKPDMYAKVLVRSQPESLVTIPKTAVLNTGKNSYVWVEEDPGLFKMQHIKIGKSYDSVYEVLEGLTPKDKVAISGGFLIDSEAQLTSGFSGGHQH